MPRPKSDAFVGFKCPEDLKFDALQLAQLGGKTEAEIWKEAMELKLTLVRALFSDYYTLRVLLSLPPVQPGLTSAREVQPLSFSDTGR
jgi:hypothetical protein